MLWEGGLAIPPIHGPEPFIYYHHRAGAVVGFPRITMSNGTYFYCLYYCKIKKHEVILWRRLIRARASYRLNDCLLIVFTRRFNPVRQQRCEPDDLHTNTELLDMFYGGLRHTPQGLTRATWEAYYDFIQLCHAFQRKQMGAWPIRSADRSADDQMTEKGKLFKTLITQLMLVYTFLGAVLSQTRTKTQRRLCCSLSPLDVNSPTFVPHYQQRHKKIFYIPRKLLISPQIARDWEMNHKALLLWILLQCTAALFWSARGENAVLRGKKRLCVYCSFISIIYFSPSLRGKCQNPTTLMWSRANTQFFNLWMKTILSRPDLKFPYKSLFN